MIDIMAVYIYIYHGDYMSAIPLFERYLVVFVFRDINLLIEWNVVSCFTRRCFMNVVMYILICN